MSRRKVLRAREPNGRPQRETGSSAAEARRLRDASLAGMRDPEWGTELGRLFLAHKISSEQFAAGKRWAELAARYAQAIQAPAADPRSITIGESRAGTPIDPDTDEGRHEAKRHRKAVDAFRAAQSAMTETDARAVRTICEANEAISGHQQLLNLIAGLSTLASHWRLTQRPKSPSDRQGAK